MAFIQQILDFLHGSFAGTLFAVLLGISEALAQIPSVKANSVFQAVVNALKFLKDKLVGAPAADVK